MVLCGPRRGLCCRYFDAGFSLYESLSNMLELKDFHFSLWLVVTAMYVFI